jgi:hypothetical protein
MLIYNDVLQMTVKVSLLGFWTVPAEIFEVGLHGSTVVRRSLDMEW